MKHILSCLIMLGAALAAPARDVATPAWWGGVGLGGTTVSCGGSHCKNAVRPTLSFGMERRFSPAFGAGIEAGTALSVPAPSGANGAVSGLGAYARIDILRLLRPAAGRFGFGVKGGAAWAHDSRKDASVRNYPAFNASLWCAYDLTPRLSLSLAPGIGYASRQPFSPEATCGSTAFMLNAGLQYRLDTPLQYAPMYSESQINDLNLQINSLRANLKGAQATAAEASQRADRLAAELRETASRKPEVVKEVAVDNKLNAELNVFFHKASSAVSPDQMPNVERIAAYLKNHPGSYVVIKGYASREGNPESNRRLALARANSVRSLLMNRYAISPSRIDASGAGIGELFDEESWNRVSVCTLHPQ